MLNKSLKHRHFVAGQFLSRAFVVLLRKSIPQNHNLKRAAELGVTLGKKLKATASVKSQKQKLMFWEFCRFGFYASEGLYAVA